MSPALLEVSTPQPSPPEAASTALSRRQSRWEHLVWLLPVVGYFAFPQYLVLGSQVLLGGLFALSLDLLLGYSGVVSLGHAAYFGVGAYSAGLLASSGWQEPLTGLLLSGAMAAAFGFLTSWLVVRSEHLNRLMITLGFGMLLHELANRARALTGGADGLQGIVMDPLLGTFSFDLEGRTAYLYCAAVCSLLLLLVRQIVASPFGLALRGIREGVTRMPALGCSVTWRLVQVYTLSAGLAGVAGALLAQTTEFVGLHSLSFEHSAAVLIMLVIGGTGRLYGGFAGTAVYIALQENLSSWSASLWQFWIGLLVVALALGGHGGLLGAVDHLTSRWKRRVSQ